MDPALLRTPWWRLQLVLVFVLELPFLVVVWIDGSMFQSNDYEPPTIVPIAAKVAITIVLALWVALLLGLRARHGRRERAAILALRE